MKTYTEKEFKAEYERGLYNGKAEILRDLLTVIKNTNTMTYKVAFKMIDSYVLLMVDKVSKANKLRIS